MTQTWVLTTDVSLVIELPRPPLQSVTSVEYLDTNGDTQTIASTDYRVLTGTQPGAIRMIESWPDRYQYEPKPVTITYVAGYGGDPTDVPEEFRLAILQLVAFQFELGRGDMPADIPQHIKDSLASLRSGTGPEYFRGVI